MFESDDFDQVLSQFDFSSNATDKLENREPANNQQLQSNLSNKINAEPHFSKTDVHRTFSVPSSPSLQSKPSMLINSIECERTLTNPTISPKHSKRKIINSYFDRKIKRKFPGPAGLLTGTLEKSNDENICHMELLSQDVEYSHNHLRSDVFELPLWKKLCQDAGEWGLERIDSLNSIKQQALTGRLTRRKAHTVTAFVEAIDRSAIDPLVILRDVSGSIKSTLHRDAWSSFSPYIASEFCAIILWKPTVLTTGSAFKKHYLNITLSNILALYSSANFKDVDLKPLPDGYTKLSLEDFTVIKVDSCPPSHNDTLDSTENGQSKNYLEGLDTSIFLDESF